MCDTTDLEAWGRRALTRRQMSMIGASGVAAAAASACAPMAAGSGAAPTGYRISERVAEVASADGTLDGEFFFRAGRKAPGVILWPDIAGIRPAKRQMARRLAEAGYAVFLANPIIATSRASNSRTSPPLRGAAVSRRSAHGAPASRPIRS